eukprot:TRINITY_DN71700_c0_g1_i1.p2 TRINITY_DN71700_c0_g1~~TRINITY_DN71700_c0_g1_i1.p2  ORF type:complete len:419 (-),score=32.86 TRINITY_DN71700_c0_g1_i1:173-1429(-)
MIGRKRLLQQALRTLSKTQTQASKKSVPALAASSQRDFSETAPGTPPSNAESNSEPKPELFRSDLAELQKHFDMKDPYYDPYSPYIWLHILPRSWQPVLRFWRIDQNFGRMLVVNPYLWGIAIGSPLGGMPDFLNLLLFASGSIYAHAAGCAFDDLTDAKIDAVNPRCAFRPMVAKTVSKKGAWMAIGSLTVGAYGILSMLTPVAVNVGLLLTPLIMMYPYSKRFTKYPQVFLSLVLNLGAFMGYGAVTNFISWPVCTAVYLGGIAHTIGYDSILDFQDVEADKKSGVYSVSRKFVNRAKFFSASLGAIAVSMHALAGYLAGLHPIFLPVLGLGAAHFVWQTLKLNPKSPAMCNHLFMVSYRYGIAVLLAYMLGVYFAKGKKKEIEKEIDARKELEKQQELKDDLEYNIPNTNIKHQA